ADDHKQLAMIENCLAFIQSLKHNFRRAEQLYDQALERAAAANLLVTQAEIEASIGNMALFQGRYGRALDFLEQSRRRYAALDMPHQSAIAEQEIADAYLELNLAPEAATIYERVIPTFARLGMRAEQARALACAGRAALLLKQKTNARALLTEARELYAAEKNAVGQAVVILTEAQLHYAEGDYAAAARAAEAAEAPFAAAGTWRRRLLARWLHGEALRAGGDIEKARALLTQTLLDTVEHAQPQLAERCHTSLGLLSAATGDYTLAETSFKQAVRLIENLRAPLPAEEFRATFFADKLVPYDELVRLCLSDETQQRTREALGYVEMARSRALVEMLGDTLNSQREPRDAYEAKLAVQLDQLHEELNWLYNRINRPPSVAAQSPADMQSLHDAVREREDATLEIMRQLQHRSAGDTAHAEAFDVSRLQKDLGAETALVEYFSLDEELLAFVVTNESVQVVRGLGTEAEAATLLQQFRFQIDSLRYGAARMRRHLPDLTRRVQAHLQSLYDLLLRKIEKHIGRRRLVIVPHRVLHYVPFHALHTGAKYVIEEREISYAPSAAILRYCLSRPLEPLQRALLVGVPDEQTPRVRDEVRALAPLFPESEMLLDDAATLAALKKHAPQADVLHLACHGQFRPDNPLFSSLRLADEWLTVRDASRLELHCGLVTLSACETGVSHIAPGDELIGLARGFFQAGAHALVLSLWTVDDEATADLMTDFYKHLRAGKLTATALRLAQCEILKRKPHPFFWSPFVLVGHW
ncbi:MAG: CHAT domain-containing protein, partial [Pyrinomonadaceae bacterium]